MENILIEDRGEYKLMYNPKELCIYIEIEYNTDTSIPHSNMSEDIVRTTHITNESVEIRG